MKQVTNELGYDGGAWFSPDGKRSYGVRAGRKVILLLPNTSNCLLMVWLPQREWKYLLPIQMAAMLRQVTNLGQTNWAPNFTPIVSILFFCSNHEYKRGFPFNMYLINFDGSGLEKISRDKGFDAFPMFSHDGKKLIFSSNRNNGGTRDTNVFVADWAD